MEQSDKSRIGIVDLMSFFWTLAGARKKGEPAFGLALQVLRYMRGALAIKMHNLDAVAFCADGPGPSWRTAVDRAYKAHREEKPADRREELAALMTAMRGAGMCVIEEHAPKLDPSLSVAEEVLWFEGDDLCASAVAKALEGGDVPVVFSNDGDLAQLLALPGVELYSTRGEAITAERVFREWGVMPAKLGDLKALAGDSGDGYKPFPGSMIGAAKGIGEKGAVDLIKAFGSAQAAMNKALSGPRPEPVNARLMSLLRAGGQAALDRGLKLALLRSDAPLPDGIAEVTSEDWDAAEAALKKREDEQRQAARLEDERAAERERDLRAESVEAKTVDVHAVAREISKAPRTEAEVKEAEEERDPASDRGDSVGRSNAADLALIREEQAARLQRSIDEAANAERSGSCGSLLEQDTRPDTPDAKRSAAVEEAAGDRLLRRLERRTEPVLLTVDELLALGRLPVLRASLGSIVAEPVLAFFEALVEGELRMSSTSKVAFGFVSEKAAEGLSLVASAARGVHVGSTCSTDEESALAHLLCEALAVNAARGMDRPLVRAGT